jgi:glycosyltransferase involved in cell wall biosynthesis
MKVLYTTPVLEYPPAGGPQLRVENSIKALSQVCDLSVISRSPLALSEGKQTEEYYRSYCREFQVSPVANTLSRNRYLRKLQRIVLGASGLEARSEARYILDHIDRQKIDVLWCGFGNISFGLIQEIRRRRPNLKIVCDTDSVWSRFILRELPYAKGFRRPYVNWAGQRKAHEERQWVTLCDVTTAVSEVDAQYYRELVVEKSRIHIFSNVIDVASYATRPAPPDSFKSPSIYLAGTFGHPNSPMDRAAKWMLDKVMPRIQKTLPEVHFYIVGNNSDRMFGYLNDPYVTVTGKLPSVLPYLCNVDVALVPLQFESGTRFKILEAGACSIPVVSTYLGAEGIPVASGKDILLTDDPDDFADAIIRLIKDKPLAHRLAANCHELVCRQYSVEALQSEASSILRYLNVE